MATVLTQQTVINWTGLKDFTMADALGHSSGTLTPEVAKGYDIKAARLGTPRTETPRGTIVDEPRRIAALAQANGILSSLVNQRRVRFFVTEFEMTTGIAGMYGQGRRIRDFYPTNLNVPVFKVSGQMLDQWDYGLLVEFVHLSHQDALDNGKLLQFNLLGGGMKLGKDQPKTMKGTHKAITVAGVAESIQRAHQRGVYAPTFQFEFSVALSFEGLFENVIAYDETQRGFLETLIEVDKLKPFSQAPKKQPPANKVGKRG